MSLTGQKPASDDFETVVSKRSFAACGSIDVVILR